MGLATRLLAIPFSLLLSLHAASAEMIATTTASGPQLDTQNVGCRPRMSRQAIRHRRHVVYVADQAELRQGEEEKLPVRVYHLKYIKTADMESMIRPLLSSKGTIKASPGTEVGITSGSGSSVRAPGRGGSARGTPVLSVKVDGNGAGDQVVLVVCDYEQVMKSVDRVIAKIDVQPRRVLVEAAIIEITLKKDREQGVNFSVIDKAGKASSVAVNSTAGLAPAAGRATGGKSAVAASGGFAADANGWKFGWIGNNAGGFIRALETFGEARVLASPRLLVLNKQRAEIRLSDQICYQTSATSQKGAAPTVNHIDIGTKLLMRPFVSSDGAIRLELSPEHTTGHVDGLGIPQTTTCQITTNVMVPDGATVALQFPPDTEAAQDEEDLSFLDWDPCVDYLFGDTENVATKKQVIVLVTAHVWDASRAIVATHQPLVYRGEAASGLGTPSDAR